MIKIVNESMSYDEAYEQFDKFCNIYYPDKEYFDGSGNNRVAKNILSITSQIADDTITLEEDGSITFEYTWEYDKDDLGNLQPYERIVEDGGTYVLVSGEIKYDSLESFLKETDTTIPYVSTNGFSDVFGYDIWKN